MPEENYDEEYVINILAVQADLKKIEHRADQSQTNGTIEIKNHGDETEQNKITTSRQTEISTLKISKASEKEKMDQENFYH